MMAVADSNSHRVFTACWNLQTACTWESLWATNPCQTLGL